MWYAYRCYVIEKRGFMLPKNIADIVVKYRSKIDEVSAINAIVEELVYYLSSINSNITERLQLLINDINTGDEEEQLLSDSRVLRKYISTLNEIECANDISDADSMYCPCEGFDLYICYDNICPACNCKMEEENTQYDKIGFNGNTKGDITIQNCPACERKFVIDHDLDGIDIDYTNIVLHRDYCIIDELSFNDVIVLTTVTSCSSKGHNITDINAKIPVIKTNGNIEYTCRNVAYCRECNKYIMLKSDFYDIPDRIACQVIDQTTTSASSNDDEIEISQKQSVLYKYGYNVNAIDNLSDKQRHTILALVVESDILTRAQIISHLDTLIERGSKITKWKNAVGKWKQDRKYVCDYKTENLPKVITEKLILKYRTAHR